MGAKVKNVFSLYGDGAFKEYICMAYRAWKGMWLEQREAKRDCLIKLIRQSLFT